MSTIRRVKAVKTSWWIGGIIGLLLGLFIDQYDRLAGMFAGATNGIVFGLLIGWIIDRVNQKPPNNPKRHVKDVTERNYKRDTDSNKSINQPAILDRSLEFNESINNSYQMNIASGSLNDEKVRDSLILLLLKSNEQAFNLLQENEKLTAYGMAEAFIFNVFLSKIFLKKINPELFDGIRSDYDLSMVESLKALGLGSKLPNMVDFLNKRNSFFREEFEAFQTNPNYLASRLYYVFYENPLTNNPVPTSNYTKLMPFHLSFLAMMNSMKQAVEIINNQYQQSL